MNILLDFTNHFRYDCFINVLLIDNHQSMRAAPNPRLKMKAPEAMKRAANSFGSRILLQSALNSGTCKARIAKLLISANLREGVPPGVSTWA
jgi:hypothetical protein